jgi:hypothetical protein
VDRCGPTVEPHVWKSATLAQRQGLQCINIPGIRDHEVEAEDGGEEKGTYGIIPNFEILDFHPRFLRYPPQEECRGCV